MASLFEDYHKDQCRNAMDEMIGAWFNLLGDDQRVIFAMAILKLYPKPITLSAEDMKEVNLVYKEIA